MFLVLLKTALDHGLKLEVKMLSYWIEILMQRVYRLTFVYEFWKQIPEKKQQVDYYTQVVKKYEK